MNKEKYLTLLRKLKWCHMTVLRAYMKQGIQERRASEQVTLRMGMNGNHFSLKEAGRCGEDVLLPVSRSAIDP